MKSSILLLFAVVFIPMLAQAQSGGAITFFSEDGDRFYLFLNAQKQNATPVSNIRVDGLTQPYYNARIVFEDTSKHEVSRNVPTVDAGTNDPADVVMRIRRDKDGHPKMRFYSTNPMPQSYAPPTGLYYMHLGQPTPAVTETTVSQTTVTTTNNNPTNLNVSAGGVNVNIGMGADPNMIQNTTTTTTTTTTYSQTTDNTNGTYNNNNRGDGGGCQYAMAGNDFSAALSTISGSNFDDTKLSTAKSILTSNCLSTDQITQICNLFSFEDNKLAFAKYAYAHTVDPSNYFKVINALTFDSNKQALNNFISNGGR
jgi:Domain of unknown function (DUF4476)